METYPLGKSLPMCESLNKKTSKWMDMHKCDPNGHLIYSTEGKTFRKLVKIGLDKPNLQFKMAIIFLHMIFSICFGCSLRRFEYPQHMFLFRNKKIIFCYALLPKGLFVKIHTYKIFAISLPFSLKETSLYISMFIGSITRHINKNESGRNKAKVVLYRYKSNSIYDRRVECNRNSIMPSMFTVVSWLPVPLV